MPTRSVLLYCERDYNSTPELRKNNPNASGRDVLQGTPYINEEASSHPSLNPICGWLLPDRIDQTLEIYNTEGDSLGELEIHQADSERWRPAPSGKFSVTSVNDIPNPDLKRVVKL